MPNEGKRTAAAGGIAKSIGLRPGVPDLILDWPVGEFHGLRIEMKYGKNKPTKEQLGWLYRLATAGYYVAICWSARDAIQVITAYMDRRLGCLLLNKEISDKYGVPCFCDR